MAFFNKPQQANLSPRQALEAKYNSARGNLLLVVVFTLINIVLLMTNANSYFLFSAFIPYMLIDEAWFYTGRYPAEIYEEYYPDMIFSQDTLLYILVAIAFIVLLVYIFSWFFAKNNRAGWLVTALVFFSIDTVGYILYYLYYGMLDLSCIIDILFHVWVLYYLVNGLIASAKLKKLPEDAAEPEVHEAAEDEENE